MYVVDPSVKVTGSFPTGCILAPFTVRGMTVDGSMCSPRWFKAVSSATERSAPESSSVSISASPFRDDMCSQTVGTDSMSSEFPSFDTLICGVCPSVVVTESALVSRCMWSQLSRLSTPADSSQVTPSLPQVTG